jgi:hypothetical protein
MSPESKAKQKCWARAETTLITHLRHALYARRMQAVTGRWSLPPVVREID